ncbi:hypothetical protein B0H13DRAFT_1887600 [Mycena leptocephala]|nr:hypothetical protein B0H13DRAFT_1887600 [Mycena leptocephala]
MKFSTAFFAIVPLVAALPPPLRTVEVANSTAVISPETPGNVFVCTDAGFTGSCSVFNGASGQCIELPGSFNEDITDGGCTGGQLGPIRSPGSSNLNVAATVQFNDHISSFE